MVEDVDLEKLREEVIVFQNERRNIRQNYPLRIREQIRFLLNHGHDLNKLTRELKISYDALQRWGGKRVRPRATFKEIKIKPTELNVNEPKRISVVIEKGSIELRFEVGLRQINILKELLHVL